MLDYRQRQADAAQQVVNREEQKRAAMVAQIQAIDAQIQDTLGQQHALIQQDPSHGAYFSQFLWRLKAKRSLLEKNLTHQEKILAYARETLKQALIKQKSMEILKDKAHQDFQKLLAKQEEAFLAEIATQRAHRNR